MSSLANLPPNNELGMQWIVGLISFREDAANASSVFLARQEQQVYENTSVVKYAYWETSAVLQPPC